MEQARKLIEEALSSVQSLIYDLSPPILYDLGLEAALEWLGEQFHDRHELRVCFSDNGEFKGEFKAVREELQFLMFRTARELLFNVAKHAKARLAKVTLGRRGRFLELAVEDDGVGFTAFAVNGLPGASLNAGGGFGLFSIRERLEHFGGRLEVTSRLGRGTLVTATVPLEAAPGIERPA